MFIVPGGKKTKKVGTVIHSQLNPSAIASYTWKSQTIRNRVMRQETDSAEFPEYPIKIDPIEELNKRKAAAKKAASRKNKSMIVQEVPIEEKTLSSLLKDMRVTESWLRQKGEFSEAVRKHKQSFQLENFERRIRANTEILVEEKEDDVDLDAMKVFFPAKQMPRGAVTGCKVPERLWL